jgi:hypothetical protein
MNCQKCGNVNELFFEVCPNCGLKMYSSENNDVIYFEYDINMLLELISIITDIHH